MPGSLIFLTPDLCKSVIFATIAKNPNVPNSKSKTFCLKIKLEDDLFLDVLSKDLKYVMIEPSAYFECYKHILSSIKRFSESSFPLSDIIAYLDYNDPMPEYIHEKKYCLHERCSETVEPDNECLCKIFNPLNDNDWPTSDDLKLDEQQYQAFKIALTRKVAVIQGPPGTGKTFIGVKLVQALLRNVERKPIIICCLTNHALDQFLEHTLKFTKKVVRIGSQSKSIVLEPHKLENLSFAAVKKYSKEAPENEPQLVKETNKLLKKIAPDILNEEQIPNVVDIERKIIRKLTKLINKEMLLHALCKDKYLEETALNDFIDNEYKNQLRYKPGSFDKSLIAGLLEWLVCSHVTDLYNVCNNKFYELKQKKINPPPNIENIWVLNKKNRFELFYCWREKSLVERENNLKQYIEEYRICMMEKNNSNSEFKTFDSKDDIKVQILRGADIVGVTTTGACKFKNLLWHTYPHIMVIDEAAQVLESHVIASLVPSIQHLILIGDHEQLRPLPADNELSKKYLLEVSMFERLFRNKAPSATLIMQHRMKPCIAELLVPRPYEEYKSYENVYKYAEIKGVESSVFFFDHNKNEDEKFPGTSASNDFEARMIVNLAKYLNYIHYSPNQITILATYALQVVVIHNYLKAENLEEIHVTTVDNFQGEENDIILLSFVRSNKGMGFLRESNRVCVALSRARMGMYCFGNFQMFANRNDLWKEIVEKLKDKNMIGNTLYLKCPRHNTVHSVNSANDIIQFLSGCSENCNFILSCKHTCVRKCHFEDPEHLRYLCKQPCEKMIDDTRVCPHLCFQKCKKVKKNLIELPCGHLNSKTILKCLEEVPRHLPCQHFDTIPCHVDIEQHKCQASVNIILDCGHKRLVKCFQKQENPKVICNDLRQEMSPCGHMVKVPCSLHFNEKDLSSFCDKACGALLDCKHECVQLCRLCFDTGIHGFCREQCELVLTCGHKCKGYCGSPCPPCEESCLLYCGHTFCINDCVRQCVNCLLPCERKCCHKKCSKLCCEDCNIDPCMERCFEKLLCGHQCIGLCGDPCPSKCRVCNIEDFQRNGADVFYVELECEHVIQVNDLDEHIDNCLSSYEWPCCPQCSSPITRSTRYKEQLKKAKKISIVSWDTRKDISKVLYLAECMYGKDYIVPAQFIPIHKEILQKLKRKSISSDSLMVLQNCVLVLKKLLNIASQLEKNAYNDCIEEKFDMLMSWISQHLTKASFQQLRELESAVIQLQML